MIKKEAEELSIGNVENESVCPHVDKQSSETIKPFEKKFLNELDNDISISVSEVSPEERNNEFESVLIVIKGPDSVSENFITRLEAENLLNSLSEFLENTPEKAEETLENDAQSGTTQPTYIDESGKVFTAADIVQGYKPKGSYKGHSISDRIQSEDFGKVK